MPVVNPFDEFESHPNKPLRVHMDGVRAKTKNRCELSIADIAALFHDLGKLNPNFQLKIKGQKPEGYNNHSYLSALAFISYLRNNPDFRLLGLEKKGSWISVLALIAHHHGHLRDLKSLLSKEQLEKLEAFLLTKPHVPASDFLAQWQTHQPFRMHDADALAQLHSCKTITDVQLNQIQDKLGFFLDTQFAFASLIEADKRDAGYNEFYLRKEQLDDAKTKFSAPLITKLASLQPRGELDKVRTELRKTALQNLSPLLDGSDRVFSLTAPTGAGKTLMLLALADAIRAAKRDSGDYALIYGLPFLSITEQVERVCKTEIWTDWPELVTRQDSRTRRPEIEALIEQDETEPEKTSELLRLAFSGETFDGAFTLTTFVQIFETLLSNRNATLLKLPNFSKSIFLLDEIQALPPRLYVFFAAYLHEFCERFDCYAILSTATMPALQLPNSVPGDFFPRYPEKIPELLGESAFTPPVFNRYEVQPIQEDWTLETLADNAVAKERSALVIVNTIADSLALFDLVQKKASKETEVILLNTRFMLCDRKAKIARASARLKVGKRVILISTQMIEAGVDVDFPVVFRDWCPLPSLIQAAGRCNRNGELKDENDKLILGEVIFCRLVGEKGKPRAPLVYRDSADVWLLEFARQKITKPTPEIELLPIQREFFAGVNANLEVGRAKLKVEKERKTDNLIKRIQNGDFAVVGSFQLIEESDFGQEFRYYIPESDQDDAWETLERLTLEKWKAQKARGRLSFAENKTYELAIETQLRTMSERVVAIRCQLEEAPRPLPRNNGELELCGLRLLANWQCDYSFERGLASSGSTSAIL